METAAELNEAGAGAGAKEIIDPGAGAEKEDGGGELMTGAFVDVVKGFVFEPDEYTAGPELGAAALGDGAGLKEGLGADMLGADAGAE